MAKQIRQDDNKTTVFWGCPQHINSANGKPFYFIFPISLSQFNPLKIVQPIHNLLLASEHSANICACMCSCKELFFPWLPDDCLMTAWWLPDDYLMTTWWLSNDDLVKFIYSEKATKFCEIFPLLLTVCTAVKSKGKISQNFVAFSKYMNFKHKSSQYLRNKI